MHGVPVPETEQLELKVCGPIAVEQELLVTLPAVKLEVSLQLTEVKVVDLIAIEEELLVPFQAVKLDVALKLTGLQVVGPLAVNLEPIVQAPISVIQVEIDPELADVTRKTRFERFTAVYKVGIHESSHW